jgi:hypothetical protein
VAEIQAAGGTVMYDYHETAPRTMSTAGTPRGPEWLRRRLGSEYFDRPVSVTLFGAPPHEQWVQAVNRLPSIRYLLLSGKNANDGTLKLLKHSSNLIELHLTSTTVNDEGLKELVKFPELRWLVLNDTKISDAGVAHLSALGQLEELNLRGTRVTDASVAAICGIRNLQKVDLRGTHVSADGAQEIQRRLKNCRVLP